MRISDWSSDVCSSDLSLPRNLDGQSTLGEELERAVAYPEILKIRMGSRLSTQVDVPEALHAVPFPSMMLQTLVENAIKHGLRSEEHTSELQSLMRISYAVFCLKKKKTTHIPHKHHITTRTNKLRD